MAGGTLTGECGVGILDLMGSWALGQVGVGRLGEGLGQDSEQEVVPGSQ